MPDAPAPTAPITLTTHWDALWAALGLTPSSELLAHLLTRYAEPHRHYHATQHRAEPASPDEQVLVDVDLSILGATPERFAQYEAQIKAEYAWVPEAIFSEKRREVLASFLARPRLYATDTFRALYEARARNNLQQALHALA